MSKSVNMSIVGQKFGRLTVVSYYGKIGTHRRSHFLCECECGNRTIVAYSNLCNGHTKSCGCLTRGASPMRKDISGQRFGKLTAIRFSRSTEKGVTMWMFKCDCGNEVELSYESVKHGVKSCGCLTEKHNEAKTRLYKCWSSMKSRCNNTKDPHYHIYGGRGITVCDEWQKSYKSFRDWSMCNGYLDNLTLDRIDVNGNYEPVNCRWANNETQHNNKRDNVYVEYKGERLTLKQVNRKYAPHIPYNSFWHRYSVAKWDLDKCINTPLRKRKV